MAGIASFTSWAIGWAGSGLPVAPVITGPATETGVVGVELSFQIEADNSPSEYAVVGLPPGLVVDAETGIVSGVPEEAGRFVLLMSASNEYGSSTALCTLTVSLEAISGTGRYVAFYF